MYASLFLNVLILTVHLENFAKKGLCSNLSDECKIVSPVKEYMVGLQFYYFSEQHPFMCYYTCGKFSVEFIEVALLGRSVLFKHLNF